MRITSAKDSSGGSSSGRSAGVSGVKAGCMGSPTLGRTIHSTIAQKCSSSVSLYGAPIKRMFLGGGVVIVCPKFLQCQKDAKQKAKRENSTN